MEIWKEIKGFEHYEISNLGRVKSLARAIVYSSGKIRYYEDKLLTPSINKQGYLRVTLSNKGVVKTVNIHKILAVAFLNHKSSGCKLVVDHINNIKTDNRLENLQVITQRENASKDKKNFSSKYTGVYFFKRDKKWKSQIRVNGKCKHLGIFNDELEAAEAYQKALKEL